MILTTAAKAVAAKGAAAALADYAGGSFVLALFANGVELAGGGYARQAITGLGLPAEYDSGKGAAVAIVESASLAAGLVADEVRIYSADGRRLIGTSYTSVTVPGGGGTMSVRFTIPRDVIYLASRFGIVAGGTDDKAALINRALDFIADEGGGLLMLDTVGDFYVEEPVKISSKTTFQGVNRACRLVRAFSGLGETNATLRAKVLTGTQDIYIRNLGLTLLDDDQTGKALCFAKTAGFAVEHVHFGGTSGDWGTAFRDCSDGSVSYNRFEGDGGGEFEDGVHLYGGNNITIAGNEGETGDDFIALSNEDLGEALPLKDITVVGNVGKSHLACLVRLRCLNATYPVTDITIVGNRGYATAEGLSITATDGGLPIKRVTVTDYDVDCSSNANTGLYLRGVEDSKFAKTVFRSPYGRPGHIDDCHNLTIDDFEGLDQRNTGTQGVLVGENNNCSSIRFRRGVINNATHHGIQFGSGSVQVDGWEVEGVEVTGLTTFRGINLANAINGKADRNTFHGFTHAILEAGSSDGNLFRDNDARDCANGVTVIGAGSEESGTIE